MFVRSRFVFVLYSTEVEGIIEEEKNGHLAKCAKLFGNPISKFNFLMMQVLFNLQCSRAGPMKTF